MKSISGPYFDPDFESNRIVPPTVVIDNDSCDKCTLVKVDSANRDGILLEMVQVLSDLDLVISKSYISSDGGWLMDVFHVTDSDGKKLKHHSATVKLLIQSLAGTGRGVGSAVGRKNRKECAALEVTATDRPGLLSEIAAVLDELGCDIASGQSWTHNSRAAIVLYISGGMTNDRDRMAHIEEQVSCVVEAHVTEPGERWHVKVILPGKSRIHTERWLHQLLNEDRDYDGSRPLSLPVHTYSATDGVKPGSKNGLETRISIEVWKEKDYSVVNMTSRDRPKLFFDTICALTDLSYVVFHAVVSSRGPMAIQEYYIKPKNGHLLVGEGELQRVRQSLAAAVERRTCFGLRITISGRNRPGLLADVTRALRENGLSLARVEFKSNDGRGRVAGAIYVNELSSGEVSLQTMETVQKEIGGDVMLAIHDDATSSHCSTNSALYAQQQQRPRLLFSLGNLLWSHIERFSSNFGSIRS